VHTHERQAKREPSLVISSPHQLINGKLAGANIEKAESQVGSPTRGMSVVRLLFVKVHPLHQNLLRRYHDKQEMGPWETTCKNDCMSVLLKACSQWTLLRRQFCHSHEMCLGKKSQLIK
jgi:hypothetical protein